MSARSALLRERFTRQDVSARPCGCVPAATAVTTPFDALSRRARRAIEAEVADMARFLGRELDLDVGAPL